MSKSKNKKKGGQDDDDDFLASLAASNATAAPSKPAAAPTNKKKDDTALAAEAALLLAGTVAPKKKDEEEEPAAPLNGSAESSAPDAASKNKKKKKKKAASGGGAEEDDDEDEDKPVPAAPAAPKLSKAAKAAQEQLARLKKAEEERLRQEEEARQAEDAERRAEEERLRLELEEKEKKRRKRQEKKERDAAAGKPVTKAEKEKQRLLEERRKQLIAQGLVPAVTADKKPASKPERKKAPLPAAVEEEPPTLEAAVVAQVAPAPAVAANDDDSGKDWDDDDFGLDKLRAAASALVTEEAVALPLKTTTTTGKPPPATAAAAAVAKPMPAKSARTSPPAAKTATATAESASESPSDEEEEEESDSEDDEDDGAVESATAKAQRMQRVHMAREKRLARFAQAREEARKNNVLRAPIICVLGHVDTGKTKTLDMLRKTNVQEGEAGGITQQIGATFFPVENLRLVTNRLPEADRVDFRIPGLQIIDTPGHESFSNLRSRGSGLADVAIVVIDIMHGLEKQTVESLELLRSRKTRFVVALNKIDRLYGWVVHAGMPVRQSLALQKPHVMSEFETRVKQVITGLMELSFNAALYWENEDLRGTVCVIPTSAVTGEGSPDLLMMLTRLAQEQMSQRLAFSSLVECTVLEVKKIEGLGTTMDVILVNGEIKDDDTLVLATSNGPVVTQVRTLLTPQPMREMRVKNEYIVHKSVRGCMGIKVTANDLDHVVAGTSVYVLTPEDDVEELKDAVMRDVKDVMGDISTESKGVFVQASTLGSLEALMDYLRSSKVPVAGVALGPVHKKDVVRASAMVEHENEREYATILAFDVKVDPTATELAEELGVKIFTADIIYHLTDQFSLYVKEMREERKKKAAAEAVFPCICKIITGNVFHDKNPIVVGVDILRGCLVMGTPLVVPDRLVDDPLNPGSKVMLELGRVVGIEKDKVAVQRAKRGEKVCIKIQGSSNESHIQVGRHFEVENAMVSKISRKSLDLLKANFKPEVDELGPEGWPLIVSELKKTFAIP